MIRHVIFDFFGTLARYQPSAEHHVLAGSVAVLRELGVDVTEAELGSRFQAVFNDLTADAVTSLEEFSMADAANALFHHLGVTLASADVDRFVRAYMDDWSREVSLLPRLDAWLAQLPVGKSVLSNTHDTELVPAQLADAGIERHFDLVTRSVDHGRRKPHPEIYANHVAMLDLDPAETVFVGDNAECDYFGPRAEGVHAFLIAPAPVVGVDEAHRVRHLFEVAGRLAEIRG